jgi:hypothetical protein
MTTLLVLYTYYYLALEFETREKCQEAMKNPAFKLTVTACVEAKVVGRK